MDSTIIYKYFPDLTPKQKEQFNALGALYSEWNEKINVVSRKDIEELYERHVLHSLAISKFIDFKEGSRILDVGTGGGFPGIPLAILYPDVEFLLVDSVGKKIKVCKEIASHIGLENLQANHERMEKVNGEFDFVVSRAVAQTKQLYNWTRHLIAKDQKNHIPNGWLLLKGGDLKEELAAIHLKREVTDLSSFFDEPFFETKKLVYLTH